MDLLFCIPFPFFSTKQRRCTWKQSHTFSERWCIGLRGNTTSNFFNNTDEKLWSRGGDSGWPCWIPWIKNATARSMLRSMLSMQSNDCASSESWSTGRKSWKQLTKTGTRSFSFLLMTEYSTQTKTKQKKVKACHILLF